MKKTLNIIWKVALVLLVSVSLVAGGIIYTKRDEIVTSKITMKYFSEVVNKNDKEMIKGFVANSENDALYDDFVSVLNNKYYYEGVENFKFTITDQEVFGNGKYQCYFSTMFENYVPKCDIKNEQRYMNYLIEMDVSYELNDKEYNYKEKGLVVFVKDMEDGNYFTWKLVRFDKYRLESE